MVHFSPTADLNTYYFCNTVKLVIKSKVYVYSGASLTMFKIKSKAFPKIYKSGSSDSAQFAASSKNRSFLVYATLKLNISIDKSVNVPSLNDTLVSVGQICDTDKNFVFTAKKSCNYKQIMVYNESE